MLVREAIRIAWPHLYGGDRRLGIEPAVDFAAVRIELRRALRDRLHAPVGPTMVKASREMIHAALTGRSSPHYRFLLGLHLGQIDTLAAAIAAIDAEVERDLGPFREAVGLLATIPGVGGLTADMKGRQADRKSQLHLLNLTR